MKILKKVRSSERHRDFRRCSPMHLGGPFDWRESLHFRHHQLQYGSSQLLIPPLRRLHFVRSRQSRASLKHGLRGLALY